MEEGRQKQEWMQHISGPYPKTVEEIDISAQTAHGFLRSWQSRVWLSPTRGDATRGYLESRLDKALYGRRSFCTGGRDCQQKVQLLPQQEGMAPFLWPEVALSQPALILPIQHNAYIAASWQQPKAMLQCKCCFTHITKRMRQD